MQIPNIPFTLIIRDEVQVLKQSGETAYACCRTYEPGKVRIGIAEYSPVYKADHWYCRGQLIYLPEGVTFSDLNKGTLRDIKKGMNFFVNGGSENPHRSFTKSGKSLFNEN